MNEQQEQLLNEYLDGTLSEAEQAEVESLLATSAEAHAYFAELQTMFAALDELDELPLMTDLSAQVVTQLATEPSLIERWWRWIVLGQVVIAGFLLMRLWPAMQNWFMLSRDAATTYFSTFTWPELTFWQDVVARGTAVLQQLDTAPPAISLASGQWGLLIVLAFVAWLAGNRLLFNEN